MSDKKAVLEPIERLSEVLFGLIMALTFTGSLSVATAERAEVRIVLIGALTCNIAWGLIDAIFYLMACINDRGTTIKTLWEVRKAHTAHHAHSVIRGNVPDIIAEELLPEQLDRIRARVHRMPLETTKPRIDSRDLKGALGVFLIVIGSTLPVILPFVFVRDLTIAMRLSNAIAIVMLALIGFAYGRASGLSPWWTSALMVLLGLILVSLTIALGG